MFLNNTLDVIPNPLPISRITSLLLKYFLATNVSSNSIAPEAIATNLLPSIRDLSKRKKIFSYKHPFVSFLTSNFDIDFLIPGKYLAISAMIYEF